MISQAPLALLTLFHVTFASISRARVWTSIAVFHRLNPVDLQLSHQTFEHNPLRFTMMPSDVPSMQPSITPSDVPSDLPSLNPSLSPSVSIMPTIARSMNPSTLPSNLPSSEPSFTPTIHPSISPTKRPTLGSFAPTEEQYPDIEVPQNITTSYFNYDVLRNSKYGPGYPDLIRHNSTTMKIQYQNNGWTNATNPEGADFYWSEFDDGGTGIWNGTLANNLRHGNQCNNVGKQSPIDVRDNGAKCIEHHQIRNRIGDYVLGGDKIQPRIESNKLRLFFKRRPCANVNATACGEPDPPHADFPNNWGGYVDVIHVDFKVPSEHTINGERFDAEMQVFHLHPSRRRTPTVSVVIRASRNGYNPIFQSILDQFQVVFNDHGAACLSRLQRERRRATEQTTRWMTAAIHEDDFSAWTDISTEHNDPAHDESLVRRRLQYSFTPYHELLMPSLHFFGYEGSITEPPCSEFVSWFVSDTPMQIGLSQLEQMKRLLFQHVSPTCEKTSVHSGQSVARPIQDTFGRPVWRCTSSDFIADTDRFITDDSV